MIDERANPPRIARLLLQAVLRRRDAESIEGDLLEEYRAVRRPALGPVSANAWYSAHVLSVVWRLVWPFALALLAAKSVATMLEPFPRPGPWNPSLLPAPNVALLDAIVFVAAGYAGARRTGRPVTGLVAAGVIGLIDFALFAVSALFLVPGLPAAIWDKPFMLVIGATFFGIALTFALTLGAAAAAVGGWRAKRRARPGAA